jgi:hypothetical protein
VFVELTKGRGLAASIVEVYRYDEGEEGSVAHHVLLGFPPKAALMPVLRSSDPLTRGLARYIAHQGSVNLSETGRSAGKLSSLFTHWAKLNERRSMEARVFEVRGMIVSAVMGAVLAFLSSLAPLLSSLQFTLEPVTGGGQNLLVYAGGVMTVVSSGFLGLFLSRRPYVSVLVAGTVFVLTLWLVSPVLDITLPNLGGIK